MPSTSKAKTSWMVDQQMPLESFGISMSSKQRQKQKGRQPKENKTPATPANNTRSKRKGDHDELHPVKKLKATGRGVVESSMGKSEFASQDSTLGRTTRSRKALKDITICQDGHPIISEQTGKSRLTNNMQSLRGRALSESSSTTSLTGSDVIDVDDWAIITTNAKTDVSVEPLSIFDPTPKRPLPTHIQGSFGLPTPPMSSHPFNRIRRVSPLVDGDGDEIVPDSQASSSTTFTQGTAWKKPLVSSRSMGQSDYPTPVTGRMARTESRVLVDVGRVKDLFGPPSSPVTHSTANHTLNTESPPFGLMLPPHPDVDALSSNSDACDVPSSQSQYLVPFVVTPKRSRLSDFPDMHDELDDATEKGSKEWESVVPTSQSDEMELSAYKVIPSRILTPTAPEIGYHSPSQRTRVSLIAPQTPQTLSGPPEVWDRASVMHTSPMRIPSLSSMYPSSQSSAICPGIPSSPSTQVRNFLDVMADEPNWLEASDGENASPNAKHRKASSRRYSFRENDIVNGRQHGAAVGERIGHSPSFRTPLDRASSVTLPDSEDEEEIYPPARRPLSTLSTELERIRGRQAVNETQVSATQTDGGDEEHTRLTQTFAMVAPRTRHDLPTNLENETQGSVTQSSSNGDGDTTILPHARGAQAENASTVPTLVSGSSRSSIDRVDQAIYDTQNARGAESSGIEIPQPAPDNTQSSVTQPDSDSEYQELHPTVDQEDLSESYGSSSEECLPAAVKGFLEMFEEGSMPSYFRESYEG